MLEMCANKILCVDVKITDCIYLDVLNKCIVSLCCYQYGESHAWLGLWICLGFRGCSSVWGSLGGADDLQSEWKVISPAGKDWAFVGVPELRKEVKLE